jgi:LacI family transcriptional regulator
MRNDDQRIGLMKGLGVPFLAHGRALNRPMATPIWTSTMRGHFTMPRGFCCNWGTGGWPSSMATRISAFAVHRLNGVLRAIVEHGLAGRMPGQHHSAAMNEENGYNLTMALFATATRCQHAADRHAQRLDVHHAGGCPRAQPSGAEECPMTSR